MEVTKYKYEVEMVSRGEKHNIENMKDHREEM